MRYSHLVPAALTALGVFVAPLLAQVKTEETLLGPYDERGSLPTFSKEGLHFALVVPKGSRSVVMVDGVEGPRVDRVNQNEVFFSDDGLRHAYIGWAGTDYIVVLDGKEVARVPREGGVLLLQQLKFSPGGKRFTFQQQESAGAFTRLVVDGQPGELYSGIQNLVFSPDGTRFAYLATKPGDNSGKMNLVVDGKDVGYQGVNPQFSPDGKTVVTVGHTPTEDVLLMNGKPGSKAKSIRGVHMSTGGINLLVLGKQAGNGAFGEFLGVGGKMVPGSDCQKIEWVKFSPDGKRYAALCTAGPMAKYLLIDGKKGENYEDITDFAFSPDSSRTVFQGRTSTGIFRVIDGEESQAYQAYDPVVFGGGGKRVGFIANNPMTRDRDIVLDGKLVTKYRGASYLSFSPDGNRHAFIGGDYPFGTLHLDGVEQPGVAIIPAINPSSNLTNGFAFSPDGKHIAHHGFIGAREKEGLMVDRKLLGRMTQLYHAPVFSPDSQHVFCFSMNPGGGAKFALLVDGKPALTVDNLSYQRGIAPGFFLPADMGDDGVFTFIGASGGQYKRYRVTPATGTSIASVIAENEAAEAKLIADAETAKKNAADAKAKAEADRVAAAAKAKADYDAAVAKKKADADAARAAQLKAKKDAADAAAAAKAAATKK